MTNRSEPHTSVTRQDNGCCVVTLNRPEKRNCVSLSMWRDLTKLFDEFESDASVRVIMLTGAGGHFCAGADISEFESIRSEANSAELYEVEALKTLRSISRCKKPTIAAISGVCVGGGCSLALACDVRIADKTARIGITAARIGILYSRQEIELLLSAVSRSNAKRIMFTGALFSADDALQMNLIDILASEAYAEAVIICSAVAENAPLSVMGAKYLIDTITAGKVSERAEEIEVRIRAAADSKDYAEGRLAFTNKRRPRFTGN